MPDPKNPGQPSSSATERGSPVNVETSGNVSVTRKDVATGDIKDLQADLLEALCECIKDQTKTLSSVIDKTKKSIVDAVKAGGGTGGGGTGGGGKGPSGGPYGGDQRSKEERKDADTMIGSLKTIAEEMKALLAKSSPGGGGEGDSIAGDSAIAARANIDTFDALNEVAGSTKIEFDKWGKLFTQGMGIEFTKNIGNVNKSIFNFGQSLTDISTAWRKATDEAKSMMEIGQGGMIDVTALFTDLGAGLIRNRDALKASAETVMEFRDEGQLLIGTLGNNLEEVSEALRRNRDAVDDAFGDDFLGKIPFEQQNAILTDMLDIQRRVGVQTDMTTILSARSTRTQLQFLQEISFQTGQTVKEVMKLYKEEAKSYNTLEALGLLQKGEGMTTARSAERLKAGGQGAMVDTLTDIIRAGSLGQWMAKETGNAAFAAQGDNTRLLQEAVEQFKLGTNESSDAIMALARQLTNIDMGSETGAGGILAALPGLEQLAVLRMDAQTRSRAKFTDVAGAKGVQDASISGNIGQIVANTYNDIKEFLTNNFGPGGDLALAIFANIAALMLNTAALARNFMGPKMPGKFSTAVQGAKNMAVGGANKVRGGAMAARTAVAGVTTMGGMVTGGAGALATGAAAITAAGAVGYAIGTGIEKSLSYLIPDQMATMGDLLFGGADSVMAFMGSDAAQERLDGQQKFKDMQLNDARAKAESALARKGGISPIKGVAPQTSGDISAVSPSEVVSSNVVAPNDPSNIELMKQTTQLDRLIELTIIGNAARTDTLDAINKSGGPAPTGLISDPNTRKGALTPTQAFSPLFDGGPSA